MCGLVFSNINSSKDEKSLVEALGLLKHRGPDNLSYTIENNNFLGHVRLSIQDTSESGNQPMHSYCNRYLIIYNGEIYNKEFLKNKIQKEQNIEFKSSSDTEILINGYSIFGENFFNSINGIYSILIYDKTNNSIIFCRDPLGIKPLYIFKNSSKIFLASEIGPFLKIDHEFSVRYESFYEQIKYCYIPEPNTYYNEISKVTPGIIFRYNLDSNKLSEICHIRYSSSIMNTDFKNIVENSIKRQLISDVKVGCMYSGGLDSSIILKYMNEVVDDLSVFHLTSDDISRQENDTFYASRYISELDISHTFNILKFQSKDFLALIDSLDHLILEGISDPAAYNTYLICREASSKGIKVLVCGQGADELFGGYRRHRLHILRNLLPLTFSFNTKFLKFLPDKLYKFVRLLFSNYKDFIENSFSWIETQDIPNLIEFDIDEKKLNLVSKDIDKKISTKELLNIDQKYDLMSLNLNYADKMSMATGVECRVPFLDLELVNHCTNMRSSQLVNIFKGKIALKEIAKKVLPGYLINRPKSGFYSPISECLNYQNKIFKKYMNENAIKKVGLFNSSEVYEIVKNKSHRNENLIFNILCIQKFMIQNGKYYV